MYFQELFGAQDTSNMYETEEERRRRLAAQGQMPAPAPTTKPRPVKETITTDPITGERTVKIEGSERDLSALNTRTPTVTMPSQAIAAPAAPVAPPQPVAQLQPQVTAAPVAPDQFQFQNLTPEQISMMEQRMGQMGINDRGMFQGPDAAAAFNARPLAQRQATFAALRDLQGQQPPAAPTVQPAAPATAEPQAFMGGLQPTGQQAQALRADFQPAAAPAQPITTPNYYDLLQGASVNPRIRNKMLTDAGTPADVRRALLELERQDLRDLEEKKRASALVTNAVETGNFNNIARQIKQDTEGGSMVKALLYKAFGLTNLALQEEKKLGAGRTWQSATTTEGGRALLQYNADGLPIKGYDQQGNELSAEQLTQFATGQAPKGTEVEAGTYMDPMGVVKGNWVLERRAGQSVFREVGTNRVASASEAAALRKTGVQGSFQDQVRMANLRIAENVIKGAAGRLQEAKQNYIREQGPFGSATNTLTEAEFDRIHAGLFPQQMPGIQGGAGTQMQAQTPGSQVAPVAPTAVGQEPVSAAQPPAGGAAGGTGLTATTPALSPVIGGGAARPPAAGAGAAAPAPTTPPGFVSESQRKRAEEQRKALAEVGTAEQKVFVEKTATAIGEERKNAADVANLRREQLTIIANNPSIVGIMNGDGETYDRAKNIILKLMTGAYSSENSNQFYDDVARSGLNQTEIGALESFATANLAINPKTLKANSGGGAVSDAEQRANREANIQNIDQLTVYGALSGLHRSAFQADLGQAKGAFMDRNPDINTPRAFDRAWSQEQNRIMQGYQGVLQARSQFLAQIPVPGKNSTPEQRRQYRDRVFKAFEAFPAPRFNPETGSWDYQTANARRAAMAAIARGR